ncbi:MAG: sensor histidine kinase [Clostridiales bacterium]|nr:sensor histidine kinase [Clostridiales bacterium]
MRRRFLSLRSKFILVFLPLIAVPLLVTITLTHRLYDGSQQAQSRQFMRNILTQVSLNLDRYTRELDRLTMMPLMNGDYLDVFHRRESGARVVSTYAERLAISAFNVSLMLERSEIVGYTLFCLNGDIFSNAGPDTAARWTQAEESWMATARAGEGSMVFLPPNKPAYFIHSQEYMVSVARAIRDPVTMRVIGFVKIDLSNAGFRNVLYLDDNENMLFYIYNAENQKIYPYAMQYAFIPRGDKLEIEGKEYLVATVTTGESGLSVYMMYPYDVLQRDARAITAAMLQMSAVFLGVSGLLCVLFAARISRPVRSLQESLLTYSRGSLSERSPVRTRDEIGDLASGFNQMAERIQRLIREQYQAELNRQEAEILALQSQMNPHFLYNTLESVSMCALNHDDIDTSDMVSKVGKMLRYSISVQKELVRLRQEVQFVEDYLNLQAIRLGPRLTFSIRLDADLEECLVPKLILQPFVENVVTHALGDQGVHVTLHALVREETLLIEIRDDGVGMDAGRLSHIRERMYDEKNAPAAEGRGGTGIALRNVHQRIFMRFGPPYGVRVESEGRGACFTLRLPLLWKEEENRA